MTSCSCADVSLFSICQRVAPHHTTGASPGFRLHRVFAAALALVTTPEHVQHLVEEVRRATGSRFTIVVDTACSGVLMRFDVNRRQSQGSDTTSERPLAEQYTHKDGSPHGCQRQYAVWLSLTSHAYFTARFFSCTPEHVPKQGHHTLWCIFTKPLPHTLPVTFWGNSGR